MAIRRMDHLTTGASSALEARGIDSEVAAQYGVVSCAVDSHGDNREWIAFRHFVDGGEHDHWAYRTVTGDKSFFQSKGTTRRLWNNECLADPTLSHVPVIITEGQLDALSLLSAGYSRVVSVPDGAPSEPGAQGRTKYAYLEATANLAGVEQIITCGDNDNPGKALATDIALILGKARCKFVSYPDGCKDANDVLLQHGQEGATRLINEARWWQLNGLYTFDDLPPEPGETVLPTGVIGLDELWKPALGRMTVLTGIPGGGKTQLMTDICCHLAQNQGTVIAIASFEDSLRGSLVPRLQRWFLRCDPASVNAQAIDDANRWISDHFVFIQPGDTEDDNPTVEWFLERTAAAVTRHNVRMVACDPWNEMDHSTLEQNQSEYIGQALGRIRRHAKEHRYHIIIAAHPAKMARGADGKIPIPTGYNISSSANWFNKPDNGLTIHRSDEGGVTIGSWKCRLEGVIGTRGSMAFRFNPSNQRYLAAPELMP